MYLFDFDGTLVDSNGIWVDVDRTFLARHGFAYSREYYEGVAHTVLPKAAVFTKAFCHLNESCEEIVAEWMELAHDRYTRVRLKPHVREYLTLLKSRGERLALFTGCTPVHCRAAMEAHGLEPFFEQIIFAESLGLDKCEPASFEKTLRLLQVSAKDCIFFDDSVKACRSAKASGMTVIGVFDPCFADTKAEMPLVCDRFIHDFSEMMQ